MQVVRGMDHQGARLGRRESQIVVIGAETMLK